jgi:plasmid stability protein
MVDILARNVDEDVVRRLKAKAKAKGVSLNEILREAIKAYVNADKADAWAAIDAIREKIGKVSGDSTKDIREDRDSR